jgi:hypothetical protein
MLWRGGTGENVDDQVSCISVYVWRYVDGLLFDHTMLNGRGVRSLDDIVVREVSYHIRQHLCFLATLEIIRCGTSGRGVEVCLVEM